MTWKCFCRLIKVVTTDLCCLTALLWLEEPQINYSPVVISIVQNKWTIYGLV